MVENLAFICSLFLNQPLHHFVCMSEDKKIIKCPYCGKDIYCKADSNELLAIRGHCNRSQSCKQKRLRFEESSNVPRGKNPRSIVDCAHLENLRDQLFIAREENQVFCDDEHFSSGYYWNEMDEKADMDNGHFGNFSFQDIGQDQNIMAVDIEDIDDLSLKMTESHVGEEEDVVF